MICPGWLEGCIHFLWLLQKPTLKLRALRQSKFLVSQFWRPEVRQGSPRAKIKESAVEESLSLPFPASRAACTPWPRTPSTFKADFITLTLDLGSVTLSPSLTPLPPSFTYKDPSDYMRPTQIIQNNPPGSGSLTESHLQKRLLPQREVKM